MERLRIGDERVSVLGRVNARDRGKCLTRVCDRSGALIVRGSCIGWCDELGELCSLDWLLFNVESVSVLLSPANNDPNR